MLAGKCIRKVSREVMWQQSIDVGGCIADTNLDLISFFKIKIMGLKKEQNTMCVIDVYEFVDK